MPKKTVSQEKSSSNIIIKGARSNNLKNIDVEIPRNSLTVITGVSGSGKSTLAFDTLYAEGQRRYVESLSSYARQFLGRLDKPEVDYIHGISPAIAIEQKVITRNPRSTVATTTEIYDYLKILFARVGEIYSPKTGKLIKRHTVEDVINHLKQLQEGTKGFLFCKFEGNQHSSLKELIHKGYARIRQNGKMIKLTPELELDGNFELIIERFIVKHNETFEFQIADSIETAFEEGNGKCFIETVDTEGIATEFSKLLEEDGELFMEPTPQLFDFNSPAGACPTCEGFGKILGISEDLVIPDKNLSVYNYCVVPWKGEKMGQWRRQVINNAHFADFPVHTPYKDLSFEQKDMLWNGTTYFKGIHGFFDHLQAKLYKIQNRVLISRYKGKTDCYDCGGSRLRKEARYVKISGKSLNEIVVLPIYEAYDFFQKAKFTPYQQKVAKRLLDEINNRLEYLVKVGVGYISLGRLSNTLSGGESQRINLASSLGSSLVGSVYVLDEPSIGLHPHDTKQLIDILKKLRSEGNTVVVVEHDEEIMRSSSHLIDIGPKAGVFGGQVVFQGNFEKLQKSPTSLTTQYLSEKLKIEVPENKRTPKKFIEYKNASKNNLDIKSVQIPIHCFSVITGVSGSGKSTFVKNELIPELKSVLNGGESDHLEGAFKNIERVEHIDQNPIGRSSRSNPVTYVKAYDDIRTLYSNQNTSKVKGYKPGHFSLNVPGGRCEKCLGEGKITVEMQFMADLKVTCDECKGQKFQEEVLEVEYNGKNINELLNLSIDEAITFFEEHKPESGKRVSLEEKIIAKIKPLQMVGLGYVQMGQSSSTLSGGEAQRVKLAYYLVKGNTLKNSLFVFDEPTTGLHFHDIDLLLKSFYALIDKGNTILVIEHNTDVMKCADWIIDLGPGGGKNGGKLIFQGKPEDLPKDKNSVTGKFLKGKF